MRTLLPIVLILLAGYGALLGYVWFFQARLIYFPDFGRGFGADSPADAGLVYEDIIFRTADGLGLHGWFVPAGDAPGVVLFFHGNAGDITHRLDSIAFFHELGLSVFIIDYRGYGRSEGKPDERGTYLDGEAAWRYLVEDRGIDPASIVVFGRSLGASVGTWLASRVRPSALIIEAAFTSAPDLAAEFYWFLPVRALARISYDTQAYIKEVSAPKLLMHSVGDEIIPIEHGRRLFAVAGEPKAFVELRGGHNDAFLVSRSAYAQAVRDFLGRNPGLFSGECIL